MLKKIGIVLIVLSSMAGTLLFYGGGFYTQRPPARITSQTSAEKSGGTDVYTTTLIGHRAELRWDVVLPLGLVLLAGLICISVGNVHGGKSARR